MEGITILDNFINDEELQDVIDAINRSSWKHIGISGLGGVTFWYAEMIQEATLGKQMLTKIEKIFSKKYKIGRMYANGQTFGQDGSFHQDDPDDNAYTLLIYVSDITEENVEYIGGFTHFIQDGKIINVEPYKKRGLFFKSNLFHRGMAPSRLCDLLRISFAIKVAEVR
jgi:hypothetical protein